MQVLNFQEKTVTFRQLGKEFSFKAKIRGNTIPIVTNDSFKKVMKRSLFAYLNYVKDSLPPNVSNKSCVSSNNQNKKQSNLNNGASQLN